MLDFLFDGSIVCDNVLFFSLIFCCEFFNFECPVVFVLPNDRLKGLIENFELVFEIDDVLFLDFDLFLQGEGFFHLYWLSHTYASFSESICRMI